jgi:hypothetical protein
MTVTEAASKSALYVGDNVNTTFPFTFKVLDDDDVDVYLYDTVTEVQSLLTKNVDYTITLTSGGVLGGSIETTSAPTGTQKLRIFRSTPKDQQVNILSQGNFTL